MAKPVFLMSPPRRDWSLRGRANFKSRLANAADAEQARQEWRRLADAIVEAGGEVLVCPPSPRRNMTGMIYTAEAGEFFRDDQGRRCFLLPNMAVEHRRHEADWIGGFMSGLGFRCIAVTAPWEAQGDAIRGATSDTIIHTYGEGPDQRTGPSAYEEVADSLSPRHLQLRFDADRWFHGNTFMNVYRPADDEARPILLICPEAVDDADLERLTEFLEGVEVVTLSRRESQGYDTNALQVGNTILAPETLSLTAESAFERLGLDVVRLDLGELFSKGGGAPVCLTNRLWGLDADGIPDAVKWSKRGEIEDHTPM